MRVNQQNTPKSRWLKNLLLGLLAAGIVIQLTLLSPTPTEVKKTSGNANPSDLILDDNESLIPNLPKNRLAEYSIENFHYICIQNGERLWEIKAEKAFVYKPENLVHARVIHTTLFDPDGKTTLISGKEAKYFLNERDLELYGDVHTTLSDGFTTNSEYLRYQPNIKKAFIPSTYAVTGSGKQTANQLLEFESYGLDYDMKQGKVTLQKQSKVTMSREKERTTIESDHCEIERNKSIAHFTMDQSRPIQKRFVYITQPSLFARARRATLDFGANEKTFHDLLAFDDVFVKELSSTDTQPNTKKSLRYSTSGKAIFDTRHNIVELTDQPQVYQDNDTITGDIIRLHRDTDKIEVKQSNSFSMGND